MSLTQQENQDSNITKESAAETRKRQRELQKIKEKGTYVPTLLERAKDQLRAMEDPSIDILLLDESYKLGLDKDTVGKLKVFVQNIRAKNKKTQIVSEHHQLEEQEFKEKVKSFVNKKIDKLHQSILSQQTGDERAAVIVEAIDKNLFDFLEYMDNYPVPSSDFLRIIIGLKDQLEEDSFTNLFVRVCSKNGGDPLVVTPIMVEKAIRFLCDVETNQQAAYGLLRLVFINQISLSNFDVDMLTTFQQLYAHAIIRFFKSIGIKDDEIIPLLPATCFIFTTPMLGALKDGGSTLHYRLPPTLLPYLLEIISYSFCEDQDQFQSFLEVMRQGCKKHSHRLIKSDFTILLKSLIQYTCQRRKGYFNTLKPQSEAISRAFILLEERRIEQFTQEAIENLLSGGQEGFQVMKQRPKILAQRTADELKSISEEILSINQHLDIDLSTVDNNLQASEIPVFKALGITNMLPIQNLAFQICTNFAASDRKFLQYQTGQGKTALCLAIACYLSQLGRRVFILNDSQELTFRDYKKSQTIQDIIGISFVHRLHSYHSEFNDKSICYSTFEDITGPIVQKQKFEPLNTTFIIDEFDSILFEKRYKLNDILKGLNRAQQLICFTGSMMQECHKIFIKTQLSGTLINMVPRTQFTMEAVTKSEKLFMTKKDLKDAIFAECLEISLSVPIVLICDGLALEIKKMLSQKALPVEPLFELDITATDSVLTTFIMRRKERFATYIVNHQQGRGVDFPSSCEIETNGGVHVLIAGLPQFYLQLRQFIGRTARIGNKGTYSIFEYDQKAKNSSSEVYFKNKIEELKNNAIIDLSLSSKLSDANSLSHCEEEVKSNHLIPSKRLPDDLMSIEKERVPNKDDGQVNSDSHTITIHSSQQENEQISVEKIDTSLEVQPVDKKQSQFLTKREEKSQSKTLALTNRQKQKEKGQLNAVDQQYFESYGNDEIHQEMLQDVERINAYRLALSGLSDKKVVIDVGAGTGILSMIAMDYGATCVYAIEKSEICQVAISNIQKKTYKKRISVHQCLAEDFTLGLDKADLIVSEWMGYFLIFENMLPSVLAVRDNCLKEDGDIIPRQASLDIVGYFGNYKEDEQDSVPNPNIDFIEAVVATVDESQISTRKACIFEIDLRTVKNYTNEFSSQVKLYVLKDGDLSGLCSWFNCLLAKGAPLDTSPFSKLTHWKQTIFPFKTKIPIKLDEVLDLSVHARPQKDNHRALDITIKISGGTIVGEIIQEYKMNQ